MEKLLELKSSEGDIVEVFSDIVEEKEDIYIKLDKELILFSGIYFELYQNFKSGKFQLSELKEFINTENSFEVFYSESELLNKEELSEKNKNIILSKLYESDRNTSFIQTIGKRKSLKQIKIELNKNGEDYKKFELHLKNNRFKLANGIFSKYWYTSKKLGQYSTQNIQEFYNIFLKIYPNFKLAKEYGKVEILKYGRDVSYDISHLLFCLIIYELKHISEKYITNYLKNYKRYALNQHIIGRNINSISLDYFKLLFEEGILNTNHFKYNELKTELKEYFLENKEVLKKFAISDFPKLHKYNNFFKWVLEEEIFNEEDYYFIFQNLKIIDYGIYRDCGYEGIKKFLEDFNKGDILEINYFNYCLEFECTEFMKQILRYYFSDTFLCSDFRNVFSEEQLTVIFDKLGKEELKKIFISSLDMIGSYGDISSSDKKKLTEDQLNVFNIVLKLFEYKNIIDFKFVKFLLGKIWYKESFLEIVSILEKFLENIEQEKIIISPSECYILLSLFQFHFNYKLLEDLDKEKLKLINIKLFNLFFKSYEEDGNNKEEKDIHLNYFDLNAVFNDIRLSSYEYSYFKNLGINKILNLFEFLALKTKSEGGENRPDIKRLKVEASFLDEYLLDYKEGKLNRLEKDFFKYLLKKRDSIPNLIFSADGNLFVKTHNLAF